MNYSDQIALADSLADVDAGSSPPRYADEEAQISGDVARWWERDTADFAKYPVDPGWIDLDIVRGWIDTCISDHGPSCWALEGIDGAPLWLIDVDLLCLVPASSHLTYVALSYVWGDVPTSETTMANLADMQEPGALSEAKNNISIPKTISHAIGFVQALGERYLWVDKFCICQDDEESKSAQINIMGDIYNRALFTLIAASGWDANHGLRGVKGVTDPRNLSPNTGEDYVKSLQPQSSIWYSRGWTFQELYMSTRKLMFHYQTVIWECGQHVWHEVHGCQGFAKAELPLSLRITPSRQLQDLINTNLLADGQIGAFYDFVNAYNLRDLRFPADASRAFAGIMSILSKTVLMGGLFWGIPVDFFHAALLWIPREPLKRRQPENPGPTWPDPPSWSWLGWQGRIWSHNWYSVRYTGSQNTWQTLLAHLEPECEWRYMNHDNMRLEPLGPQVGGNLYSPCLRARARVGSLRFVEDSTTFSSYVEARQLHILTKDGTYERCGILLGDDLWSLVGDTDIECVVISRCTGGFLPSLEPQYPFSGVQDYYNFLWVNRDGDAMYRRGIGRVVRRLWDKHIGDTFQDIQLC